MDSLALRAFWVHQPDSIGRNTNERMYDIQWEMWEGKGRGGV